MPEELRDRVGWAEVVEAGARAFRERGAAEVSLDGIAGDLGAKRSAVNYWFESEAAILEAMMRIRQQWFMEEVWSRLAPLETHSVKLRELLELCVADYEATYWLELWKLALRDTRARETHQRLIANYRDMIGRVVRAGAEAGEFRFTESIGLASHTLTSLVAGFAVLATMGDPKVTPERMLENLVEAAERLLLADLSQRAPLPGPLRPAS